MSPKILILGTLLILTGAAVAAPVELPDDRSNWYLSVIGDPADEDYQRLVRWFDVDPHLHQLRDETHFALVDVNSPMAERHVYPGMGSPCVRLLTGDGRVAFQAAGAQLPARPYHLAQQLRRGCLFGRCPVPQPKPEVIPLPKVEPPKIHIGPPMAPPPPPQLRGTISRPLPKPQPAGPPWALLGILVTVGLALGVGVQWHKTHV